MSKPDYILDIASLAQPQGAQSGAPASADGGGVSQPHVGRPWLAIQWRCCSVYSRVYRQPHEQRYDARCPRCGRQVRIAVGAGGTDARFFEVR